MPPKRVKRVPAAKSSIDSGLLSLVQNLHKRLSALEPVVVNKDVKDQKDSKHAVPRLLKTKGNGRLATTKQSFSGAVSSIGSIGTALGTVITLTPGTAGEFASYAALFDDVRTTHVEVFVKIFQTTTNSVTGTLQGSLQAPGDAILVYDPVDNTSFSSIQAGLNYQQSTGVWSMLAGVVNLATTRNGFQHLKAKIPAPVVDPGILTDLLDSNWVSTKDTAVVVGYLKAYATAPGAAQYLVIQTYLRYHCEFRSRT